jgi:cytochrome P450
VLRPRSVANMFSYTNSKKHSTRKRCISNIYSKSYVQNSAALSDITHVLIQERLIPQLQDLAKKGTAFDILPLISAATMDFVTSYLFGLNPSSDFLRKEDERDKFLQSYTSRHAYTYYPQEIPGVTAFLEKIGIRLVPKWVDTANTYIEDWTLEMYDAAAKNESSSGLNPVHDTPEVYRQLNSAFDKKAAKEGKLANKKYSGYKRKRIASEVLDHLAAGFDTSGITLAYFIHELSQHPDSETALRKELRSRKPSSARELDALPVLQATLQETLRLRSAIPGPQPRITPATGCQLGPDLEFYVPPNTRVSAQAHSLHRNPNVFKDPEAWLPDRWLSSSEDELKEMNRWFWAFGSGGRMCVGSNLAIHMMKYIIAAIYTDFTVIIVDDKGFEQMDLYTAPPTSGKLIVRLESIT